MVAGPSSVIFPESSIAAANLNATSIDDIALDFFVRLRAPTVTDADRAACARWIVADNAHRAAWEKVESLWATLDAVDVTGMARDSRPVLNPVTRSSMLSRRQAWRLAAAAAVAGAGFATWSATMPGLMADYRTGRAERLPVSLPDGNQAFLAPRSAMSLAFEAGRRGAELYDGIGYFNIDKDDPRPFVVSAGDISITGSNTAFEIQRRNTQQRVAVANGEVEISGRDGITRRLSAGEMIRQVDGHFGETRAIATGEIAAWRQDRLIFRRTPLGDVAAELERYRNGMVFVTDAALAAREVSGIFDSRRTDQALETIADTMTARLVRISHLIVLIEPVG